MAATAANIQNVRVAGGPLPGTSSGSVQEATLDVEWASAMAPGAVIRVYAADANDPVGDDELIQQILADLPTQPTLHQLTISFGADESTSARDYIAIEAQYMASLVSAGVTVFAASGDTGARTFAEQGWRADRRCDRCDLHRPCGDWRHRREIRRCHRQCGRNGGECAGHRCHRRREPGPARQSSARAQTGGGAGILISGFSVSGNVPSVQPK